MTAPDNFSISSESRASTHRPRSLLPSLFVALLATLFGLSYASSIFAKTTNPGENIAQHSNCFSCHAIDHKVVGPAFTAVAKRYAGKPGVKAVLEKAIKLGHVGSWGQVVPMPPHPNLTQAQLDALVTWILSGFPTPSKHTTAVALKTYKYTVNGNQTTTAFPVFQSGTRKVTKSVLRGYELFNSYCFRCHGVDATGSEYAPDLRVALDNGMTEQEMMQIAMVGRKAKGMPAWAGFFSPLDLKAIYQYVKARSTHLVHQGVPPH